MQKITGAGPRDVIALVWFRLGFRPRESLVVVGLHGPNRRAGLVARVGLGELGEAGAAVARIAGLLRRSGDDAAVVLVVSDVDGGPRPGPDGVPALPHRRLCAEVGQRLSERGIEVFDVLAVGPRSFRSYLCEDVRCCPAAGTPLESVTGTEVAATMVLAGLSVAASEQDLLADVEPGRAQLPTGAGAAGSDDGWGRPGQRRQALARWQALLEADPAARTAPLSPAGAMSATDLAGLLDALEELPFRDAVMLTLMPGAGDLPERLLDGRAGPRTQDLLEGRPDPELTGRGRRLLAQLAAAAPPGRRAEPLAVLAWMSWWCGDGARGRLLAERALADRPGHRLAVLVSTALATATPPPWASRQQPAAGEPG